MRPWSWWFGIILGALLIADGVAETVRLLSTGDGGLVFWFGTLVGGGVLVIAGTLLLPTRPAAGCALTAVGCVAGMAPTMWTVVGPLLLLTLVIVSARTAAATLESRT